MLRDELQGLEVSVWLDTLERAAGQPHQAGLPIIEEAARQKEEARVALERLYAAAEALSAQMREKDVEADRLRFESQSREAAAAELESAIAVLKNNVQNNLDNARAHPGGPGPAGRPGGQPGGPDRPAAGAAGRDRGQADSDAGGAAGQERAGPGGGPALPGPWHGSWRNCGRRRPWRTATAAEAKALLSALAAAAQEVLDRDETVRQELRELDSRLEEGRAAQRQARKALAKAVEERDAVQNVISGYALRLESRRKKAEQARERHMKLQMDENALSSRVKMLTEMEKLHEGYSKAVKLVMGEAQRGSLQHIHGPVADLLKVPEEYTVAIETALGGAMQNLVVDREEDGKAVIQYLKRRDAGRATILPLSSIRPGELREGQALRREPGFVGVGDQLISFQPQYRNVFSNLLGRVAVMEDLDHAIAAARKYGYKFRIVTLDGQVLNPGGSMTGGSASRSAGILSRANELERLNEQGRGLREQLAQAAKALEEADREAAAAGYEMETAQSQLREWEDAILKAEGEAAHCDSVVADLERQSSSQREELEQLKSRSAQIESDTRGARSRIQELEGAAAALKSEAEGKVRGQTDLQDRSARITRELSELTASLAALEAEQETTAKSLGELKSLRDDMAGDREQNQALIGQYEEKNRQFTQEIGEKTARLQELRAENQVRSEEIRALGEEKLALEGQRNQADKDSRAKNDELLAMEREVSILEQRKVAAAMEEKQLLDKLWETYELSHEAAKQHRVEIESVPKASRRIGELKRAISSLGSINLGAIEEYQRVNERYTYLTDQRDDVQRAKGELEEIIADITGEMKTIFAREFQTIDQAFGQTFTELFGGGKATLELEDPEDILNCGIEIKVQPPGKALKIITLLSGGEKAFVAIALYFAILKVRPTPFVVMDEIEAALDDNNVARFAHYMRSMADKTQFIVITHRRGTMEEADVLYGVTMQEQGVSRMLTINLNDVEKELKIR